ncbi:Thiosulfate sulfurtransferase PspE precursor [candidate division SR1 bacterium Aalborg_AAW-1]|nr:Thiosulfate sulfurtransferase PspE precursor [candidate division SR1 bacterium Aalborg_AAW-1]
MNNKLILTSFFALLLILGGCGSSTTVTGPTSTSTNKSQNNYSDSLYVDVRENDERAAGHVSGAIHLPLGTIQAGQTSNLPKDQPLIVYCRSGRRSALALTELKSQGFTNIIDGGGMNDLKNVQIVQ